MSFESEGGSTMMHPGHHKKATLWQMVCLKSGYWVKKNIKSSLITFKEDNPLVVASQPPQRFPFGVWYNSFSSADIHGMNASTVQIANQQSSIEIRNSGHG